MFESKFLFIPENVKRSIEPFVDGDLCAWWGERRVGAEELDVLRIQRDGPIVVDMALLDTAEDVLEIDALCTAMNISQRVRVSEALVKVVQEALIEKPVGVFDSRDGVFA